MCKVGDQNDLITIFYYRDNNVLSLQLVPHQRCSYNEIQQKSVWNTKDRPPSYHLAKLFVTIVRKLNEPLLLHASFLQFILSLPRFVRPLSQLPNFVHQLVTWFLVLFDDFVLFSPLCIYRCLPSFIDTSPFLCLSLLVCLEVFSTYRFDRPSLGECVP